MPTASADGRDVADLLPNWRYRGGDLIRRSGSIVAFANPLKRGGA